MKMKLNKIQREAVEANEGPVLIFAGAGSGKTKVLTQKIHRLIKIEKLNPENILSVTVIVQVPFIGDPRKSEKSPTGKYVVGASIFENPPAGSGIVLLATPSTIVPL